MKASKAEKKQMKKEKKKAQKEKKSTNRKEKNRMRHGDEDEAAASTPSLAKRIKTNSGSSSASSAGEGAFTPIIAAVVNETWEKEERARKKKNKFSQPSVRASSITPLRMSMQEVTRRSDRVNRFASPTSVSATTNQTKTQDNLSFSAPTPARRQSSTNDKHVLGTSTSLEKKYLRLTAPPHPSSVRPLGVLEGALENVKDKWKREHKYPFACEQLKSIRQDLTVQGVSENHPFSVVVYEIHARIALEQGDLGEFNQCMSSLKLLYPNLRTSLEGGNSNNSTGGKRGKRKQANDTSTRMGLQHELEFLAYRILYALHTDNKIELISLLGHANDQTNRNNVDNAKADPGLLHALAVVDAVHSEDFFEFFQLFKVDRAPNMNIYLMDCLVKRVRVRAYRVFLRAIVPSIPMAWFQVQLGFEQSLKYEEGDLSTFLVDQQASFMRDSKTGALAIDTKASRATLPTSSS